MSTMKKIIVLISILVISLTGGIKTSVKEKQVKPFEYKYPINNIVYEKRLIQVESEGKAYAVSYKNARGEYQITWPLLVTYNKSHKIKYHLYEMHDTKKARFVYLWFVSWLEKNAKKKYPGDYRSQIVYITNSYNMGPYFIMYNHTYLKQIVPSSWATFKEGKRFYYVRRRGNLYCKEY